MIGMTLCESGQVVAIEKDWVWVDTHQTGSCQSCAAKAGCGQGLLSSFFSGKRHLIRVAINSIDEPVQLYDQVEIAIPEHALLLGSFWLYLLPLLLLMTGAVAGNYLGNAQGDLYSILGAASGFLLALFMVRGYSYLHRVDSAYQPVLHRILRDETSGVQLLVLS